jgi:hypothetical protein
VLGAHRSPTVAVTPVGGSGWVANPLTGSTRWRHPDISDSDDFFGAYLAAVRDGVVAPALTEDHTFECIDRAFDAGLQAVERSRARGGPGARAKLRSSGASISQVASQNQGGSPRLQPWEESDSTPTEVGYSGSVEILFYRQLSRQNSRSAGVGLLVRETASFDG